VSVGEQSAFAEGEKVWEYDGHESSNIERQDTQEICKYAEWNVVKNMARCRFEHGSLYAHLIL